MAYLLPGLARLVVDCVRYRIRDLVWVESGSLMWIARIAAYNWVDDTYSMDDCNQWYPQTALKPCCQSCVVHHFHQLSVTTSATLMYCSDGAIIRDLFPWNRVPAQKIRKAMKNPCLSLLYYSGPLCTC